MPLPSLKKLLADPALRLLLTYYCRVGYEAALHCQGIDDPSPLCQRLAARSLELVEVAQRHLARTYQFNQGQGRELFGHLSKDLFDQLLEKGDISRLSLETALTAPV